VGDGSATVVAVIEGHRWRAPELAGAAVIARLARSGAPYEVLPAAGSQTPGPGTRGELTGGVREVCHEFTLALRGLSGAQGFAVVGGARALPLPETKREPAHAAAVAALIARVAHVQVAPVVQHAYRVDLDGDGQPEVVLQATHPELEGDPAKLRRQHHSLIVVLSGRGAEPAFTGYLQAARELADFQVLTLDSVTDVDGDGRPELLVRARHVEGWQTQVFRYNGRLEEVFRSTSGEGQCPEGE
jgi:hypothetical protein